MGQYFIDLEVNNGDSKTILGQSENSVSTLWTSSYSPTIGYDISSEPLTDVYIQSKNIIPSIIKS